MLPCSATYHNVCKGGHVIGVIQGHSPSFFICQVKSIIFRCKFCDEPKVALLWFVTVVTYVVRVLQRVMMHLHLLVVICSAVVGVHVVVHTWAGWPSIGARITQITICVISQGETQYWTNLPQKLCIRFICPK